MISTVFVPGEREKLRNYSAALYCAGGIPICSTDYSNAAVCRGLLLPGGGDIGKCLDAEEQKLIQSFVDSKRPILGICRGMQALNVYFGGSLYAFVPGHQIDEGDLLHKTLAGGHVARLIGRRPMVNSNHHQAIRAIGSDLQVVQVAEDGIAEAIVHQRLPIWGVQWHPERQSFGLRREDAADAAAIFAYFLSQMR